MTLHWISKPFHELDLSELYALLRLRIQVFVVEQACPFQDIDGQDEVAYHLLGKTANGELVSYARLFDAGKCYDQVSIGRVVVDPGYRRYGLGRELMNEAIRQCAAHFGEQPIKIGAQYYLREFYQSLGFQQQGELYLEDGIEHIHMIRA